MTLLIPLEIWQQIIEFIPLTFLVSLTGISKHHDWITKNVIIKKITTASNTHHPLIKSYLTKQIKSNKQELINHLSFCSTSNQIFNTAVDIFHFVDLSVGEELIFNLAIKGYQSAQIFISLEHNSPQFQSQNHKAIRKEWRQKWIQNRLIFQHWCEIELAIAKIVNQLIFKNEHLPHFPPEIGLCRFLAVFKCINCGLSQIPPEIGKLKFLLNLHLEQNHLETLPVEIGNCSNLRILNLCRNQISSFPFELSKCLLLKEINCSINNLSSLPSQLSNLQNLSHVDFSFNLFKSFPDPLLKCSNLQKVDFSHNQMRLFPKELLLWSKMKQITLFQNLISKLPIQIGLLQNLEILYIAFNQIKSLPLEINDLENLKVVDCAENNFQQLYFHNLPNLTRLTVGNPNLKSISITNCPKLEHLLDATHTDQNQSHRPHFHIQNCPSLPPSN